MDAVLRFVEAGLGIAVVPSMVLAGRPGLHGTPLVLPDEPDDRHPHGLQRTIALAHRKDVSPTHAARAFSETLENHLIEAAMAESLPAGVEAIGPVGRTA
jgi:DNA-binding transcriptional LysR family regulator